MTTIVSLAEYIRQHPTKSITHHHTLAFIDKEQRLRERARVALLEVLNQKHSHKP